MSNILLVEDDALYATNLEAQLYKMGFTEVVTVATFEDAMVHLHINHVDLLITDISLAGDKTGIDLALNIKSWLIPTIFITANEDVSVYKQTDTISQSSYIVKPFHSYTLESTIRIMLKKNNNSLFLCLDAQSGTIINIEDIMYIEVENTYTFVYTPTRKSAYKKSLTQLMTQLPMHLFIQIHRKYLVQKKFIQKIDLEKNHVRLTNNIILPISRRMKQSIKKQFISL